ncbi:MAG: methylmalonyl-CoA epimerase [Caldiserica bacterium]|nr:MAG: methylmalonyl-CoA epimerase [Caldisericota bacterium]
MIEKIDHIGIAVKSIEESKNFFEDILGLNVVFEETLPDSGVKALGLSIGESRLELLEAYGENSPIEKFIEKKGEGLHHIALKVDDIEKMLKLLKDKGFRLIDEKPRIGAEGKKIAFVHPKSTHGILMELVEEK